ncbi:MAG TPA: site-specific DNA-methyltransferase, partial [Vicinamibacterales bacterium]|nr:site-specific DNA-methyltransferase [Vicinamibacterales bacterium]
NVGAKPSDPWTALDVAQAVRPHLRMQNIIHWIKSIAIDQASAGAAAGLTRDLAVGHYKPINSDRFLNDCHEFVFHFTPTGTTELDRLALGVPYQDPSNIARWSAAADGVRCRGNTWFIPYETIQRRDRDRPHPATFPSRLAEQCLKLHGLDRIQSVMDPFTGLGSTAVACARHDVAFIGSDIDETYLQEAVERTWNAALDRAALEKRPAKARRGEAREKATAS